MKAIIVVVLVALFAVAMATSPRPSRERIQGWIKKAKEAKPELAEKVEKAKTKVTDIKNKVEKAKTRVAEYKRAEAAKGKLTKARETLKNLRVKKDKTESDILGMLVGMGAKLALSKIGSKGGKKPKGEQSEQAEKPKKQKKQKGGKKSKKADAEADFVEAIMPYAPQIISGISKLFRRKKKNKKTAAPAPEAAPESDAEATTDCGMAYQNGQQLGNKQCVLVQGKPVVVETAIAFEKMNAAAKAAGITLQVNSGFRTQKEQEYLYSCYQTKKCNNGNLAARPGYSNHQNGRAMDISCSNPAVFKWMSNNASKFGFIRTVPSENWHWELLPGKNCKAVVNYPCA